MSTSTIGQFFSNRVEELISEFTGHTLTNCNVNEEFLLLPASTQA